MKANYSKLFSNVLFTALAVSLYIVILLMVSPAEAARGGKGGGNGGDEEPPQYNSSAMIVFSAGSKSSDGTIYAINGDGSGLQTVLAGNKSTFNVEPAWSPDDTKIVFSSNRGTIAGLYIMSLETGSVYCLVATNRSSSFGGHSPAWYGEWIIYQDWNPEDPANEDDLYAVKVDGVDGCENEHPINLTNSHGVYESSPTWTPDGNQLAAVVIDTETGTDMSRVVVYDFDLEPDEDGVGIKPTLSPSRTIAGPSGEILLSGMSRVEWSNNDLNLIATTDYPDIFILDLDSTSPSCVGQYGPGQVRTACPGSYVTNIGSSGGNFSWSCNDDEIIFRGRPDNFTSSRSIYSLNIVNGTTTNLLEGEKSLGNSSVSPSSRRYCED